VKRVDGNAVSAESRAGVEGFEAKGFGGCCVYGFPNIDAHFVGGDFHFVDEADIDGAVNVLEQLGKLGNFTLANGHDFIVHRTIKPQSGNSPAETLSHVVRLVLHGGEIGHKGTIFLDNVRLK
jgi:hypothetical protein